MMVFLPTVLDPVLLELGAIIVIPNVSLAPHCSIWSEHRELVMLEIDENHNCIEL